MAVSDKSEPSLTDIMENINSMKESDSAEIQDFQNKISKLEKLELKINEMN